MLLLLINLFVYSYNLLFPQYTKLDNYFDSINLLQCNTIEGLESINLYEKYRSNNHKHIKTQLYKSKQNLLDNVTKMFPSVKSENKKKSINAYNNNKIAMFETEMEGIKTGNSRRNPKMGFIKPSGFISNIERDGYKDRG